MTPERRALLARLLTEARISAIDRWAEDEDRYGTPSVEKALFLREAWRRVIRKGDTTWLDKDIAAAEANMGRTDLYATRFLPERPDTLAALRDARASNLDPKALSHILREAQICVLLELIDLLDGGISFDDGLEDRWVICARDGDQEPSAPFGDMKDVAWSFNPDRDA